MIVVPLDTQDGQRAVAMTPRDRVREHAKRAREAAQLATDPMIKARLHEIANDLEKLAEELEGPSDPDQRSC
jgi:hypothetical protein